MVKVEEFNTGDRVQDYNLADHYIKEHGEGRIVALPDCVIVISGEDFAES